MSTQMPASTFKHAAQVDEPTFSASDLKAHLDSQAEEIIAWFNATHIGTDKIHIGDNPAARSYNNTSQSIANNSNTVLSFNSERFDNDNIHDNSTNNSRLTCKTAGKYLILATVIFDSNATGQRRAMITINGGGSIAVDSRSAISGDYTHCNVSTVFSLGVNDYVECVVYQNSGGALNTSFPGNYFNEFIMARVG